jgi:hypothetical protein
MSEVWIELLVHACKKAEDLDMKADLIVGSGWPFGGEFLKDDEIIQRVIPHQLVIRGEAAITETKSGLINTLINDLSSNNHHITFNEKYPPELLYASLLKMPISELAEIDLMNEFDSNGSLQVPLDQEKSYLLCYGVIQKGHRMVVHGSPGAAGVVMDHYKKEVTLAYLSRLKAISSQTGIPLSELIRALFCDSIELAGSNWSDGFSKMFSDRYAYAIEPYMPFVFSEESKTLELINHSSEVLDQIKRARYDFNRMLVDVFLENFTSVFQEFCTSEGLLCRYQAYGTPFLMGMLEGFMIPDIPESNNWIYSPDGTPKTDMDAPTWDWNQFHGYMIWNMYAAAGGHLKGRKIISCESMTNTRGVFKTSLEEIKQHDDMNFITGINHSVLHGFNYSPPEAGFPGWVRYGAYFNEQNPWWPYLHHWVDYNARLSYIFQHSQAHKSIALLGPTADLWSEVGLIRQPFHMEPWYLHRLWQPISQAGYSAEYLNEKVIQNAKVDQGLIEFGPMKFWALMLANVRSLAPETAEKIKEYVENGGFLLVLDQWPERSPGLQHADQHDQFVNEAFQDLKSSYPKQVFFEPSPPYQEELNAWTYGLLDKLPIKPDVLIENPDPDVYQIHQSRDKEEIFFFTNVHRQDPAQIKASFPSIKGSAYVWDPETGERWKYPDHSGKGEYLIKLQPLESLLLVFEEAAAEAPEWPEKDKLVPVQTLEKEWDVRGVHVNGSRFEWEFPELVDLAESSDPDQNSFAGQLIYSTTFENTGQATHLHLGATHRGVTRLKINGEEVGVNWYGDALFYITPHVSPGENQLEITYSTVLANYCVDLDDPVARRWTAYRTKVPCGIEGPVAFMKSDH